MTDSSLKIEAWLMSFVSEAGAVAGTAVVLISTGRSVEVPVEARVTFRVKEPVTITEKLN